MSLLALLAAVAMAGPPQAGAGSSLSYEEGIARNPRTATVLYREQHWLRSEANRPLERIVIYRCPDGTAFGRKRIDYRQSPTAPEFAFDDLRSGYREGLRRGAVVSLFYRANGNAAELSAPVRSAPLVADAGFDEFIRRHWAPLIAGKSLPLEFALPSRLRSMAFSLRRVGESTLAGEPAWVFRLKLDGWLGWLVPDMQVSYGQRSRRLLRFEGLSNLRDDAGDKPLVARIDFPVGARAVAENQWRLASAMPLSACRSGR